MRAAGYGHTLGGAVGLAVVENAGGVTEEWLAGTKLTVDCAETVVPVTASLRPMYDPERTPHPVLTFPGRPAGA